MPKKTETFPYDTAELLTTAELQESFLAEILATGDVAEISRARETVERAKRLAAGRSDQSGL